jgi:hypothetical protein
MRTETGWKKGSALHSSPGRHENDGPDLIVEMGSEFTGLARVSLAKVAATYLGVLGSRQALSSNLMELAGHWQGFGTDECA